jgi:hypothetical protein
MMSETVSASSMTVSSRLDQQVQLGSSEASEDALTGIYADIGRPNGRYWSSMLPFNVGAAWIRGVDSDERGPGTALADG